MKCAGPFATIFLTLLLVTAAAAQQPPADRTQSGEGDGTAFDLNVLASSVAERQQARPLPDDPEARAVALTRQYMQRCWQMTAGSPVAVTLAVTLNPDGTLQNEPRVVHTIDGTPEQRQEAVERALRAVNRCAPFPFATDPVLASHYETWREIELNFSAPR